MFEVHANCCQTTGDDRPVVMEMKFKEHVYLQIGSPATRHALGAQYECPSCGMVVLKVEESFAAEPTKELWGDYS